VGNQPPQPLSESRNPAHIGTYGCLIQPGMEPDVGGLLE
jgi:hypothetical protein